MQKPTISTEEFITWLKDRHDLKNKTASVEATAKLLRVTPMSVWTWLSGKSNPSNSSHAFMAYIVAHPPVAEEFFIDDHHKIE